MVTNVLQLLRIYARKQNEVIVIRRILTCTVSVLLLLGAFLLPMRAEAPRRIAKAGGRDDCFREAERAKQPVLQRSGGRVAE